MSESEDNLSAIHIFKYVQKYIEKTNSAPLTPAIIKFNQEQATKGDDEQGFPFARIDTGFPESDDQLAFVVDFFEHGVGLGFSGGGDGAWRAYEELGDTDKAVSIVLTNILTAFSNGQIKILLTTLEDNGYVQAIEILYRKPGKNSYDAISTADMFLSPRKLKHQSLTTEIFANKADIKEINLDINKSLLLLLSGVDPDVINHIGRKKMIDLSEPLTPEILKQNIDAYAEKMGDRAAAKVNAKFNQFDVNMGIQDMTMWEQFIHFARWRHFELMTWGFAMLTAYHWATWTIGSINPAVLLVGISLIPLYIFRKRYPYPQILYVFAPIGYVLFATGTIVFLRDFTPHWITWVIAVFAVISICESIFFDAYFIRQKLLDKFLAWVRK